MLCHGKHFYLRMPFLLKTRSLLWMGRNWGPLSPACQQPPSLSHLSNTCFILIRDRMMMIYGEYRVIWVNSKRKKNKSYFISLGKVSSHSGSQHFSYPTPLLSYEWKWFLIFFPGRRSPNLQATAMCQLALNSWVKGHFSGFSHLLY